MSLERMEFWVSSFGEKRYHTDSSLFRTTLTIVRFTLATTIIPPATNPATLQEDGAGVISTNACTDLSKDVLGVRWRRRLTCIIFAPTFRCTIGTETARKGVTGRYLHSCITCVREWCLDGWNDDQSWNAKEALTWTNFPLGGVDSP